MALLKYLAKSIDVENEVEEKKSRQLRTNPNSKRFSMKFPIVVENCYVGFLIDNLARDCREIGDVQNKTSNVKASMTSWFMHETNEDFMTVANLAMKLA